jgi:8-oxo-dGTP pyrophosphatase MutT (NUDIX family)
LKKSFNPLITALQQRFTLPLPGEEAQYEMAPDLRLSRAELYSTFTNTKRAAVLILIHEYNGEPCFILIERTPYEGVHGGQIALPGGKAEDEETNESAAIRETTEELGIKASEIKLLGQLTDLIIPASNFRVVPLVGFLENHVELIPDKREVESVMHVPLSCLLSSSSISKKQFKANKNKMVIANCYSFEHYLVWGATAMILSEFSYLLKDIIKE